MIEQFADAPLAVVFAEGDGQPVREQRDGVSRLAERFDGGTDIGLQVHQHIDGAGHHIAGEKGAFGDHHARRAGRKRRRSEADHRIAED